MTSDLSDTDILRRQQAVAKRIADKLNTVKLPCSVATAMDMLARRIVASGDSLNVLRNNAVPGYVFDAASILRSVYDAMLQGLYIMADPNKRDERAQLFLDFRDIERKRRIGLMDANRTALAKRVSNSPKRPNAEPEIEKRFMAVKPRYLSKKGKVRDTWYSGSLRGLAKAAGLESEYELIQRFLSGVVHSSPLTIQEGPFVSDYLLDWYWQFTFRMLGAYAEYKKIVLDQTENRLIDSARQNIFNLS